MKTMSTGGFTFDHPSMDWNATDTYQEFKRFKEHVSFVFAGPLSKATNAERAGWLGMWVGQQGRELHKTFSWAEGEKEDPGKVLGKYEEYVSPRKNKRVSRFRFHQRVQKEDESFDTFLKDLRLLAMDCQFHDTEDILIDGIINGSRHKKVQERLLYEGQELTLTKSIQIARQFELSQQQLREMRGEDSGIAAVKPQKAIYKPKKAQLYPAVEQQARDKPQNLHTCGRCGNDQTHKKTRGKCPALGSTCTYCKKRNHWQTVCRARKTNRVYAMEPRSPEVSYTAQDSDSTEDEEDRSYINAVEPSHRAKQDRWLVRLEVGRSTKTFRIDTGAKCNVIVASKYKKLRNKGVLRRSRINLYSYSNHKINSLGVATIPIRYNSIDLETDFEIVDLEQDNIISGDLAEQLGLIQRVSKVNTRVETQTQLPHEFQDFPDLANVTGTLPGTYTIKIDPSAKGVVHPTRRQPVMLRDKVIEKLKEMENDGFITRVEEPTEWVSSMVVSLRKDKVRICIDPRDLNKAIRREHHPMKTIEEIVSNIPSAKVFSVLDAKSGFLQIKLDHESSMLTTFNTPMGRYRWLRLAFGLKCAPEIYQRIMDQMLEGIEGATAIMDDILIAGRDMKHHDQILHQVIERATSYNLRLNYEKCHIRQPSVRYIGHLITAEGLKPDPEKIKAVAEMPDPQDQSDVKRFLGFVTYLAKFIPNLSDVDKPLRLLLKTDVKFEWQHEHKASFQKLKELCTHAPVLAYYDTRKAVEIQCDASSTGVGAVLLQDGRPVAYSSRSMTATESRYAQIEKEMLSIVHATTKFHHYVFGRHVQVYNDHKPLESIFLKPILSAPMRLQRMMLKLQWYDLTVTYRKGKDMQLADTLSRAYIPGEDPGNNDDLEYINTLKFVPITGTKHSEIQQATSTELKNLHFVILSGWPERREDVHITARPYWDSRDQLVVQDGIIFKGTRIVIPPSLRSQMLKLLHESHLGVVKCKQRAREVMYWPAMNAQIEDTVRRCDRCAEYQNRLPPEPLMPTPVPDLPFIEVGIDLFHFESKHYLILVDYYSKFIEVDELQDQTTSSTIQALKNQFCRHGIPEKCRSDNGPQFSSSDFQQFCKEYGVDHITSSPHFPQSNGEAERGIQTVKRLWKKVKDKQKALLDYRTTPLEGINQSPAQLLMGRRPRNTLPSSRKLLEHTSYNRESVQRHFQMEKMKQKQYYDSRPGVKPLPSLRPEDAVRMAPLPESNAWLPAKVDQQHKSPRSFVVECPKSGRKYRRNRRHLRPYPEASSLVNDTSRLDFTTGYNSLNSDNIASPLPDTPKAAVSEMEESSDRNTTPVTANPQVTRSGRNIRKPKKLDL